MLSWFLCKIPVALPVEVAVILPLPTIADKYSNESSAEP
jgi:hypothetical protein